MSLRNLFSVASVCILLILPCSAILADSLDIIPDSTINQIADSSIETASIETESESIYPLSPERKEMLARYSAFKNIWRFISFFLGLGIMALFLFSGLSAKIRDWAQVAKKKFFILWLYLVIFMTIDYLLSFPFEFYRSFIIESNYGFMNQTFMEWFSEGLLSLLLSALIIIIPVWLLYYTIEKLKRWWLAFSLGAIPFIVFMVVVTPVFISPLYNDFTSLEDKQLEKEILALAEANGIENSNVFQVNASKQSTKLNAYVTGLFNTKRIVLYDTMIKNFTYEEIKFVMGHEMGHYVMNHLWKGLSLVIIFIMFSFWLTDKTIHKIIHKFKNRLKFEKLADIASLPLIMIYLSLISFLFNPISNGFSRYLEHRADIYGMENTEVSGESAAIAFDKLSVYNLSDPDPHPFIEFWFYGHPSLKKRMEFVRGYQRQ